jgi:hypothetical protein
MAQKEQNYWMRCLIVMAKRKVYTLPEIEAQPSSLQCPSCSGYENAWAHLDNRNREGETE